MKLALRILSAFYDSTVSVTKTEMEALKSCFKGDSNGMSIEEIAVAIILRELNLRSRSQGV